MPNEERIKKLEGKQKEIEKNIEGLVEIDKGIMAAFDKNRDLWKSNIELWKKFLWLIYLIILVINIELVIRAGGWIWNALSENWRIFIIGAMWSLFLVFLTIFFTKRFLSKPNNSESSQNRNNTKINKG